MKKTTKQKNTCGYCKKTINAKKGHCEPPCQHMKEYHVYTPQKYGLNSVKCNVCKQKIPLRDASLFEAGTGVLCSECFMGR